MKVTNLKKTLLATAIAVATITPAAAAEMKYPNWFAYDQASRADWDARYGDKYPGERSRPFFSCDYTPRTCLDGKISISAGDTYFIGVVVDGTDRTTVLAHVACDWSPRRAMSCADFDRGIDRNGKMVTMPDMPSSCVEEMRKSGIECEGYSSSLGQAASGNRAKSVERQAPPNYIKLPSGYITPKHECSVDDVVCVDCTFLSDQVCYEQADKVGLINHNIGFGPGQTPPARIDPLTMKNTTKPLEGECGMDRNNTKSISMPITGSSKSGTMGKYGKLICPVAGAVAIDGAAARAEIARAKSDAEEKKKLKVRDILTFNQPQIACTNIKDTYEVAKAAGGSIYTAIEVANQNKFDCDLINFKTGNRRYVAEKRDDHPGWAYFCLGFLVGYSNQEDHSRACQWIYLRDQR
jgi:hypothetical protein